MECRLPVGEVVEHLGHDEVLGPQRLCVDRQRRSAGLERLLATLGSVHAAGEVERGAYRKSIGSVRLLGDFEHALAVRLRVLALAVEGSELPEQRTESV